MSSKSEMAAIYSDLAPQFLFYLGLEFDKIQKQIDRLKGGDEEPVGDVRDSSASAETRPVLLDEEVASEDPDLEDLATSDGE